MDKASKENYRQCWHTQKSEEQKEEKKTLLKLTSCDGPTGEKKVRSIEEFIANAARSNKMKHKRGE